MIPLLLLCGLVTGAANNAVSSPVQTGCVRTRGLTIKKKPLNKVIHSFFWYNYISRIVCFKNRISEFKINFYRRLHVVVNKNCELKCVSI